MNGMKGFIAGSFITLMLFNGVLPAISIEEKNLTKQNEQTVLRSGAEYINFDWWKNFNDPFLEDYIMRAVNYNHSLKIAAISTKEYWEYYKLQFAGELPAASFGFSPAYVKMSETASSDFQFALPFIANYELDLFLKNRDKTKSAKKNYEMSLFDERAAYISVASAVGSTYLNIVNLDGMIDLQQKIVEERKTIFELMQKRNRAGITSTADLIRADKAYLQAKTELVEYEKQRQTLLHSLCVLIGESPENAAEIKRVNPNDLKFAGIIPENIASGVIENRPDCMRASKKIEKAGLDVRVAKKEFLPTLNIGGLALFNASDFGSILTTKNMLNAIGGFVGLDIFKGGAKFANLRLNKNIYQRTLEEYLQTNLNAIQEINDSLVAIKKDNEKLDTVLKQEEFEKSDYGFYLKRYEQGIVSKLDLSQSKENLLVVNKLAQNQKTEVLIDYISLYKATGSSI